MKTLIFFLLLFLFCFPVLADEVLLDLQDNVGDDYGPGYYTYPLHSHFYPYEGLFDLQRFRVRQGADVYYFDFTFGEITDPWNSFFGFSHPLVHLYIDNASGGSTEPVKPVLDIKMSSEYPWNRALVFSGWWIQGLKAGEEWRSPEQEISWDSPLPTSLEGADMWVDNTTITLQVPDSWVGDLKQAHYYVFVGGYDPLEPYHFRRVEPEATYWAFGGAEGNSHPVIDILLPEGEQQEKVLAQEDPVIKPVGIVDKEERLLVWPFSVIISVLLLSFIVYFARRKKES